LTKQSLPDLLNDPHYCLLIGEVAQAHDGSLGTAHAYIDAIADAGADAVKFQTHIAAAESTPHEPWRVRFSPQDETRYDYWRRMEFSEDQWHGLRAHAEERGLFFLSSPFSSEAVALLQRVGVAAWKVASGEVNNEPMMREMLATGLPILLSTGMSSFAEIDAAVAMVRLAGVPLALMQCASRYPCPPAAVGLNLLARYRQRYACPVGLSDHSATIFPALAAASLGAVVVEVHVTLSRQSFGPDVCASLTCEEFAQLARGLRFISAMRANPVDKDAVAESLAPMRRLFNKSVVARRELAAGSVLTANDLAVKKPGSGIPAQRLDSLIGRVLCRDLAADDLLREEDLEEAAP